MDKLKAWIATTPYYNYELSVASADASFRKYYRLTKAQKSFIVMDSSLELDALKPFLDVTARLLKAGVKAPQIFEENLQQGYLILEDFGNDALLSLLDAENYKHFYTKAIDTIISMQNASTKALPLYDKKFLHFEMDLMQEWYLEKKLGITLDDKSQKLLTSTLNTISEIVLEQPQHLFVHRDFHSRNIMITPEHELGVIDYQDAMSGAITYDLVSLLKDCYISFDREEILKLVLLFKEKKGLDVEDARFIKWFDFMGMQRHIKVLGIFSRLHLRDKKDGYLKDIPLTLSYTLDAMRRYEETKRLATYLKEVTQ